MRKKKATWTKAAIIETIVAFTGMFLTCGSILGLLIHDPDTSVIVPGVIAMVGIIGSVSLATHLSIRHDSRQKRRAGKMASTQRRKTSDKPRKPVQKFIPHILSEPVPEAPAVPRYSREEIQRRGRTMESWNAQAEAYIIQLLQEFPPSQRHEARHRLHAFKWLNKPMMMIAVLLDAQGDLDRLETMIEYGNADYRDLMMVLWS